MGGSPGRKIPIGRGRPPNDVIKLLNSLCVRPDAGVMNDDLSDSWQ